MGHTETLVTVRSSFAPNVEFRVNFWGQQDPHEQVKKVLYGWTQVTGLNWEAAPREQMEAHEDWRGFRVTHPVYNRADCEFIWQVRRAKLAERPVCGWVAPSALKSQAAGKKSPSTQFSSVQASRYGVPSIHGQDDQQP